MPEISASTTFELEVDGQSSPVSVARFTAVEALSSLFQVELVLTSEDKDIAFGDVVGKSATLKLESDGSEPRYLNGIVSRFRHAEDGKKLSVYHATLVPKVWRLRHRHDSRIFQEKSVPDILKAVLDDAGVSAYRIAVEGSYSPREYCVQYRESDFSFMSRLMEEEGIYYFFEHAQGEHTLVIADSMSTPAPIPGGDTIPYKGSLGAMAFGESISRFSSMEEVRPGKVTLTDFNFQKPSLSLLGSASANLDSDLEIYDYPGEYDAPAGGSAYAKVRLEEWQARRAVVAGESGSVRLTPGYLVTMSDHPRDADNRKYLLIESRHRGSQPQMGEAGTGGEGPSYHHAFQAIPSDVPFRPERVTPRPTVRGVQTAIVTGPGGEEIHTDQHGRVKVHFHWDRKGKTDDTSSCWIRVSQLWAGAAWGAMWIPRVGHEVIVDFLEGDPDRPIILGRVYHGTNVPPYALPAEKTKSTIKSESSKGGGGYNELRFEDKKGSEEIWVHGQKDLNTKVEHDEGRAVGHDQAIEIGHDRTKRVDHDQSETIGNDKSITVGGSHTETITKDESLDVGGGRDVSVGKDHSETVGGNQTISVGGEYSFSASKGAAVNVGKALNEAVTEDSNETVGKNKSVSVAENYALTVSKDGSVKITKNATEDVGEKKSVIVGNELSVQVGDAVVTIKKDGTISVAGKHVTLKASGPIEVQGGKLQLKSDGDVDLEASGAVKIKGSTVGVN